MNKFNYENTEIVAQKGGKVVRKVSIKKGRGYKTITKYHKGKRLYTVKKPIHTSHLKLIKKGKFIPGLFKDCKNCKTKKRQGGNDIEMGPDVEPVKPYPVPPDPERFKRYEEQMRIRSASPDEAVQLFSGPTPEGKQTIEREKMADEDPMNQDQWHELQILKNGGKRRRRGGDLQPNNVAIEPMEDSNERQNMLAELQDLMRQNQQQMQSFQALDNELYEIEQMNEEDRNQNMNRANELQTQMNQMLDLNEELRERFESLRATYFQRYGTPQI